MSPRQSPLIPRVWLVGTGVVYVLLLGYLVVFRQQLLVGVVPGIVLVVFYFLWRVLTALEAIADAR